MRCADCVANHRVYCFLDSGREVPHIVLSGIRIVYVPKVERTWTMDIRGVLS